MRIGLSTPVVVQVPGVASEWESAADVEELVTVARAADDLGYAFLTCSEHVAIPTADAATRGAVYWDPAATLGYLAAHTSTIRLATSVLVLGYHHPLQIAKQYGTLDRLSGGRLILGVGIGSLTAEFDLLGAQWARRAARADDAIAALRASMSTTTPAYHSEFYSYAGMTVQPHAVAPRVPIWVGGRSAQSLQRAVRLADGWMPFGLRLEEIAAMLASVDTPAEFEVVLALGGLDPGADPETARIRIDRARAAGATMASCSVVAQSVVHYCDQLALLKDIADDV